MISTLARGVFLLGLLVADDDALVLALSTIAGIVGLAVSAPFQAALLTVLYFDTRVRTEDFDLERLAGELGADAPSAGAPPPAGSSRPTPRTRRASGCGHRRRAGTAAGRGRAGAPASASPGERPRPDAPPPPPGWRPPPPRDRERARRRRRLGRAARG